MVVIVDDDELIRGSLGGLVKEEAGLPAVTFASAEEFLTSGRREANSMSSRGSSYALSKLCHLLLLFVRLSPRCHLTLDCHLSFNILTQARTDSLERDPFISMQIRSTTSAALFGMPVAFRTSAKGSKHDSAIQTRGIQKCPG